MDASSTRHRKMRRILVSFVLVVSAWLAVFSLDLLSSQRLSASEQVYQNSIEAVTDRDSRDVSAGMPIIGEFIDDQAASDVWQPPVRNCSAFARGEPHRQVHAFLPGSLPWAHLSLEASCGVIGTLLPLWYTLDMKAGASTLTGLSADTREPAQRFIASRGGLMEVFPVITVSPAAAAALETAPNSESSALPWLGQRWTEEDRTGLCLDVSAFGVATGRGVMTLAKEFLRQARGARKAACLIFGPEADSGVLSRLSADADKVIVKAAIEPWVGSPVAPLASRKWVGAVAERALAAVGRDKLVMAVGTYSAEWTSDRPVPELLPYAEAITRLEQAQTRPRLDPASGNWAASYVDPRGARRSVWMLDAVTALNQIRSLEDAGVKNIALLSLGQEDPTLWPVLAQGRLRSEALDPLKQITVTNYVKTVGEGPFVEPLAPPAAGFRDFAMSEAGTIVEARYDRLPRAAIVRHYGQAAPGRVVLTFDDGPHPEHTADILDILKKTETPGSFFVLGNAALDHPGLVERILEEGHELGSHTYSHPRMSAISPARARIEVNSVQMLLNGITGRAVHLYREPYMRSGSPIALRDVASIARVSEAGYKIAGMDVVPKDWEDVSGEELAAETIRQVESGGSVILLHDGGGEQHRTAEALPIIISELRARGYEFVLLADLLGLPRDALMPEAGTVKSAFSRLSFRAFGGGWSMLEAAFWTVLLVGFVRAMLSLLLAVLRRRHEVPEPSAWPTVTVVIPAYNEASVIGRCIESTLASDYPNFEVIVVDDGSTDGTWRAAELYQASGQVRLFRQANGGKASALNLALDETESEIFVGIDADSCVHPQALRRLARHFEDPEVGAVAGRVLVGNRERLLTKLQSLEYVVAQGVDRRAKEFLNGIPVVPGAIGAWRANAVLEAGIYSDETLTEDADLTMAIIRTGYRVVYEEDAIATTEAPATVRNLLLQRLRWSLGMMQASWKHRRAVREGRGLGLLTLPEIAIFGYLLPLLAPLADLFLLLVAYDWASEALGLRQAVPLDLPHHALLAYLALPAAEIAVIFAAFAFDRQEDRRLLWLIPLQRLLYRPLLYVSVIRALWRASTGTLAKWASVTRQGHTYDLARIA